MAGYGTAKPGRRRRKKKNSTLTAYKALVVCILLIGGLFLCSRCYQLWKIHENMQQTLRQEQTLREENKRLKEKKEHLGEEDEVADLAREEFGLAKPGEIPYRR